MAVTKNTKKKEGRIKRYFKSRNSRLLAIVLLSIMLPMIIFINAPFEMFSNNISELTFSANDFMGILGSFSLLVTIILFCLLYFVPHVVYRFLYPALFAILLMFFLQTNYLNLGLNSLAGDDADSAGFASSTLIWNTSVWLLFIVGFIVLFQFVKIKNIVSLVSLILTIAIYATQIMNFTITLLNTEDAFASAIERAYGKYEDDPRFITYKDINKIGSDRNVIIFCVDRLDTVLYAEPAMERYPEVFNELDGFTFYSDMTSMYGYTFPSVAYMMSGMEYDHGEQREYFHRVYNENQTISALHENGYSVHLYSEAYYDYYNANEMPTYIENMVETSKDTLYTKVRKPMKFGLQLLKASLYRGLPFILKDDVGNLNSDSFNEYILYESDDLDGNKNYSYYQEDVREEMLVFDNQFEGTSDKNFSFIHLSGCHTAGYDEEWDRTKKQDFVVSARNSFDLINDYLRNLKTVSPDAYKNSTIVIMADHGKVDFKERHSDMDNSILAAAFIKPAGVADEDQGYSISNAPVSSKNLWATIFQSEGLEYDREVFGDSFFDVEKNFKATGIYPERKFIWTKRNKNLTKYEAITYTIVGEARNFDNWTETEVIKVNHPLFLN